MENMEKIIEELDKRANHHGLYVFEFNSCYFVRRQDNHDCMQRGSSTSLEVVIGYLDECDKINGIVPNFKTLADQDNHLIQLLKKAGN